MTMSQPQLDVERPIDFEPPQPLGIDEATRRRDELASEKLPSGRKTPPVLVKLSAWFGPWMRDTAVPFLIRVRDGLTPAWKFVRAVAKTVTGLGWTALGLGVLAWVLGALFGWVEAGVIAVFALVVFALGALFTIGRTNVEVGLTLAPMRVIVGQAAIASFEISNPSPKRQRAVRVRLPIGEASAHFAVPALAPDESYEEGWVTIPSERRGVVDVGPVITYRDDPLGLVRREVAWTEVAQLYIHPAIVGLDEIGTGLLRDLEGRSTQDMSNSDLAFHTLREYVPGDDRRYIHWKSSARLSAVSGEDQFLIRQFLDTRKVHVAVLSDLEPTHFASQDEFEVSLSCAASVAARTVMDGMDLTVLCGDQVVSHSTSNYALDPYSRAELVENPAKHQSSLLIDFERVRAQAGDASMAVILTGSGTPFDELMVGRSIIPYTVSMLVVRVSIGEKISLRQTGTFTELTVGSLADLPGALRGGLA